MRGIRIFIAVIIIILVLVGILLALRNRGTDVLQIFVAPTPTPQEEQVVISPTPADDTDEEWETYESSALGFSINHPPDIEITTEQNGAVSLTRFGPTQEENTEFYDGISLTFNEGTYTQADLEAFVASEAASIRNQPVVDNVTEVEQTSVSNIEGYTFEVTSLGTRSYTYLPKGDNQYLEIVNQTADPTNQGFDEIVERMLTSLELIESEG